MKAIFDDTGICLAIGDGDGFEHGIALPKKMTSTLAFRYRLEDGKVIDLYAGKSDEQATAEHQAKLQDEEEARRRASASTAQPAPRPITKLAFMERFTDEELAAIYAAAKTDVRVEVWMDKLKLASEVDLADPRTQAGVQALEAMGLIAEGRAAQILA